MKSDHGWTLLYRIQHKQNPSQHLYVFCLLKISCSAWLFLRLYVIIFLYSYIKAGGEMKYNIVKEAFLVP